MAPGYSNRRSPQGPSEAVLVGPAVRTIPGSTWRRRRTADPTKLKLTILAVPRLGPERPDILPDRAIGQGRGSAVLSGRSLASLGSQVCYRPDRVFEMSNRNGWRRRFPREDAMRCEPEGSGRACPTIRGRIRIVANGHR